MSLPTILPRPTIRSRWVRASKEPTGKRIGKYTMIVDKCYGPSDGFERGQIHSIKVAYVRDHPFLAELNALPHVPRAVKAIYRGSVRLAHMQATEGWPVYRAMDAAYSAWEEYIKTAKENHQ